MYVGLGVSVWGSVFSSSIIDSKLNVLFNTFSLRLYGIGLLIDATTYNQVGAHTG